MRILVTNDDGIRSPGVQVLAQKMLELGDVVLAAPLEEKVQLDMELRLGILYVCVRLRLMG